MDYGAYPERSNWKKKYELAIPIILLILVIGVLAWQMGWLDFVPGIGERRVMDVLIVGEDDPLRHQLEEEVGGLNLNVIDMERAREIEDPAFLEHFDLIILTEELGEQPGDIPSTFRSHISERLGKGTDLILYGLAGTTDPAEPQTDGWTQHDMNKYIPVDCSGSGVCTVEKEGYPGDMLSMAIMQKDHPIIREFGPSYDFPEYLTNITYAPMNTRSGSEVITQIKVEDPVGKTDPGIVETSWVGGRAIYFAYHPVETPTILKNTIDYLR